jgi:hypothetical protein
MFSDNVVLTTSDIVQDNVKVKLAGSRLLLCSWLFTDVVDILHQPNTFNDAA